MKELIVIGSGTFAQIAKVYFEEYAGVKINKFAVSKELLEETVVESGTDLLSVEDLLQLSPDKYEVFVAIGYRKLNLARQAMYNTFRDAGFSFPERRSRCFHSLLEESRTKLVLSKLQSFRKDIG